MTDFSSVLNKIRGGNSAAFHAFLLENADFGDVLALARAFLCESFENSCNCMVCNKIENNLHADVKVHDGADDKGLSVDVIRQISADLYVKPNESERKIYVLQNADFMTVQAANALLKSLEEPPCYGVFVLTASSRFKLPETIRSRCALISLPVKPGVEKQPSALAAEVIACIEKRDEFGLFATLSLIKNRDEIGRLVNELREIFAKNIRQNNLNIQINSTPALFDVLEKLEEYLKSNMQIRLLAAVTSTKIMNELRS